MQLQRFTMEGPPLVAVELPERAPGAGELAIRVGACAVCRTDLQICRGELPARPLPFVPGHQVAGRVEAVGPDVHGWRRGDRAGAFWLASADGTCSFCRAGRENLCRQATFTGWDRDGGFADRVLVRADFTLRLPEGPTDADLAPLLCGGVIGLRALHRSGIQPGQRLGLYGFGASGRLCLQIARLWKCRVFVVTRSREDQDRARALGAEWAGAADAMPPEPLDAAVTTAPSGDVVRAALRALDRGGTVAINAIHLDRIPELPYAELWWERSLASVANVTRADAVEFLALAGEASIRADVEVHPLSEANEALARLERGDLHGTAVLVP